MRVKLEFRKMLCWGFANLFLHFVHSLFRAEAINFIIYKSVCL